VLQSVLLVVAALFLIWIYATIRFKWDFALASVIAITHDSLVDRIFHLAATEKTVIPPAQALQKHTASFNGYCREKIENENFFLVQTETIDQNRVKCVVYTGTKKSPGTAFLDLVMLKENDGIWRCEQILIHQ
ncbi:MAG: hypothetical protein IKK25_01775, partial [Lentisphaeria bacterium]|nr:hypothetical protein [Lentisphaeria bacterium]